MSTLRVMKNALWRLSMLGLPRGPHITRYTMYKRLKAVADALPQRKGDVLSISHSANLAELMGIEATTLVEANYPEQNFLALDFADESFDFVFSDQVLEHVEGNPQKAIDESLRVLRTGGIAVHTTCFINPIHGFPKDFWRFTPDALRLLSAGFSEILDCDGWGNFACWSYVNDGLRYVGVPHAAWHPLHKAAVHNDPDWPISTWVVAKK